MAIRLVEDSASMPVSVAQVKANINVEHDADDSLIESIILAAVDQCEGLTNRKLVSATYDWIANCFPEWGRSNPYAEIKLPLPPLQSVTSISYVDTAGAARTLDSSLYVVDTASVPGLVRPVYSLWWPATRDFPGSATIRFVAGWPMDESSPQVWTGPEAIKQWLMIRVADWYAQRESFIAGTQKTDMPHSFWNGLLDRYLVPAGL